jgi:hypothetical protein
MEVLTWGAVIAAGGSIVGLIKFWMDMGRYHERTEAAATAARAAAEKYDELIREFADYRVTLEVKIAIVKTLAEVNTTALTAAENRMSQALEGLISRLDGFNTRVDRLLEHRAAE